MGGISLDPVQRDRAPSNAGETVAFDAGESFVTLNAANVLHPDGATVPNYPTVKWNFGDGTPEVSG